MALHGRHAGGAVAVCWPRIRQQIGADLELDEQFRQILGQLDLLGQRVGRQTEEDLAAENASDGSQSGRSSWCHQRARERESARLQLRLDLEHEHAQQRGLELRGSEGGTEAALLVGEGGDGVGDCQRIVHAESQSGRNNGMR